MSGADQAGEGGGEDEAIAARLRVLATCCTALVAAVLGTAAVIGWHGWGPGAGDLLESPPTDSFLISFAAMLLVLLASAVHARLLRRPASDERGDPEPEEEAVGASPEREREAVGEAAVASRLRAFSWATGVAFAMLAAAAAAGAVVASAGKAPFYGLVICAATLFAMLARWPRRSAFEMTLHLDRSQPAPGTGGTS